ncbi:ArgS-related anticodon-binding protein NrtL [Streptomyces sp. NPDC050560]|uniref:ArgS-related anticodon-binding protein NrtL n=1 Tax=Streptomyces sp. NPDC050560 TaxID=3365630 RepID=UPI0037B391ED
MNPVELSRTVLRAVERAVAAGELVVAVPERAVVERPRAGGCGDYATGIALRVAAEAGVPGREAAGVLRERLLDEPGIARVDITGPGFLNITLDGAGARAGGVGVLRRILEGGSVEFGTARGSLGGAGRPGRLGESSGPGGPGGPDVAGGEGLGVVLVRPVEVRAVVVADALGRLLRAQGVVDVRFEDDHGAEGRRGIGAGGVPDAWVRGFGLGPAASGAPATPGAPHTTAPPAAAPRTSPSDASPYPKRYVRPLPAVSDPLVLGRDAGRWALLAPGAGRRELGRECLVQRDSNPLFRVRYAHSRARALVREAGRLGFASRVDEAEAVLLGSDAVTGAVAPTGAGTSGAMPSGAVTGDTAPGGPATSGATPADPPTPGAATTPGPSTDSEAPATATTRLLDLLADQPAELRIAARLGAPDRVARGLVRIADAFLAFHGAVPVLPSGDEKPSAAHRARLALVEAAGTVLAGGLTLLGIDAPDLI